MDLDTTIRRIVFKESEETNDGIFRANGTNDLQRPRDQYDREMQDRKVVRYYGRNPRPGESVHMLTDEKGKVYPVLFDSQEQHAAFHNLNPLCQGVFRTPNGSYVVRPLKQIVDVDMRSRPRVIQDKHGPIPYMFTTLAPDVGLPVVRWQGRW